MDAGWTRQYCNYHRLQYFTSTHKFRRKPSRNLCKHSYISVTLEGVEDQLCLVQRAAEVLTVDAGAPRLARDIRNMPRMLNLFPPEVAGTDKAAGTGGAQVGTVGGHRLGNT